MVLGVQGRTDFWKLCFDLVGPLKWVSIEILTSAPSREGLSVLKDLRSQASLGFGGFAAHVEPPTPSPMTSQRSGFIVFNGGYLGVSENRGP